MTYEELVAQVQACASKMDAKAITDHLAVQFNVEGEAEGAFYLEISSGHISVEPYEYYDHDVVVIATAKQVLDIFTGKLDPAKALYQGKIKAEGNGSRIGLLNEIIKKTPEKKPAAKKTEAKKAEVKKEEPKKAEAKKAEAKKEEPEKAEVKKTEAKKEEPKKAEVKKEAVKKAEAKKEEAKKEEPKKPAAAEKKAEVKTEAKQSAAKKTAAKKSSK